MKKLFLISACFVLAFSSCKKDSAKITTSNTLSVTIGGVNETFTSNVTAQSIIDTPGYTIGIAGFRGSGTSEEGLQLEVNSNSPVTTGTYTINSSTSQDATSFPLIGYYKGIGSSGQLTYGTDFTGANSSTITITALSSTNVQGTFSGVIINEGGGSDTQTLASGKFNVNITKAK